MAKKNTYSVSSKVWLYPGSSANWHFITVPKKESEDIKKKFGKNARGWGSLPVEATIGKTVWKSSIFPDKKTATYLLPLKMQIRRAEKLDAGDAASISIKIIP
jgi:hypothetical protein